MAANTLTATDALWFLAGHVEENEPLRYVLIHSTPFTVGRRRDVSLCIPRRTISSAHAEIVEQDGSLVLRDLKSTNGTYVNGQRLEGEQPLKEGDLVQFANVAFRVRQQAAGRDVQTVQEDVCDRALALVQFDKLMNERAVIPYYQPIVALEGGEVEGYEVLGRSRFFGLETPGAMFQAAAQLNLEVELSRMLRWEGISVGAQLPTRPHLFVNTHPVELVEAGLLESLQAVREMNPDQRITLEIHEAAVTDPDKMQNLRSALVDLEMGLAYDDFGAGQTRLVELVEVRPDYLKFDMTLVQGIDRSSSKRRHMLATLVKMARDLGIVPLAEGIEYEGEGEVCRELGFELAQGFFYGKPAPLKFYSVPE